MNEFLDVSELLLDKFTPAQRESALRVFEARRQLELCQAYVKYDLLNVETVFSAIETGGLLSMLGQMHPEEVPKLADDIRSVIVATLTKSLKFPVSNQRPNLPGSYGAFVSKTLMQQDGQPRKGVALLTFNYDIGIDFALYTRHLPTNYGLDGGLNADCVNLLKLHGSVNWFSCSKCNAIIPYEIARRVENVPWYQHDGRSVFMIFPSDEVNLSHCGEPVRAAPVIVPPTWGKFEYQKAIANVWRAAASALSTARTIVVIGYSLPQSDQFFQHLLGLGLTSKGSLRNFMLLDPSESVRDKFRAVLGPSATARFPDSNFVNSRFADGLDSIAALVHGSR